MKIITCHSWISECLIYFTSCSEHWSRPSDAILVRHGSLNKDPHTTLINVNSTTKLVNCFLINPDIDYVAVGVKPKKLRKRPSIFATIVQWYGPLSIWWRIWCINQIWAELFAILMCTQSLMCWFWADGPMSGGWDGCGNWRYFFIQYSLSWQWRGWFFQDGQAI